MESDAVGNEVLPPTFTDQLMHNTHPSVHPFYNPIHSSPILPGYMPSSHPFHASI